MIARMTITQNQQLQQRASTLDDETLQKEMGQVALELANIRAAIAELGDHGQVEEPDLSDLTAALEYLSQPVVFDTEAMRRAKILEETLIKKQIIFSNERRGRERRAAYIAVAAHLRENRKTLNAAAAVVRDNLALAGRLGVPAQIDGGFPLSVNQALKYADTFGE